MKKLLTILTCLVFATMAFGQWDMIKGPVDVDYPDDAVALDATTVLTVMDNIVKKTTDFGANWTEILLPDGVNARDIDAVGDVVYVSADGGLVFKSVDAGETWVSVGDSTFTLDMCVIDVLDSNTVFVGADDGYFFKTLDGGTTWDTTVMATDDDLDGGVAFTTALNGIVFDDGTAGIIHVTDDGGDTWSDYAVVLPFGVTSKRMYAAQAVGSSTFLIGAYHNIMWLSTDNGATWAQTGENTYGYDRIVKVRTIDENNFIALNSVSDVFTTNDGGTTWDTLSIGSAQSGQAMAFSSMTNGMIWSSYGQDYSTTDGVTFVPMHEWPEIAFYSLTMPAADKIIATATYGGEISISEDAGQTWSYPTNAETGAKSSIYASLSIDENTILLGGSSGYIGKSTDGGDTWTIIDNPMAQLSNKHVYMLYLADNGDVYAGGSSGMIMRSTDDGDTWTELENSATQSVYGMCIFSNGLAMLGQGSGQFAVSTSTSLDTFEMVADYGSMSFRTPKQVGDDVLIIGGDDIYTTTIDALDTLAVSFTSPTNDNLYGFEFVSDSVAFVAGDDGAIFRTDDAGATWEQEMSEAYDYLYDLKYDGEYLWAVGKFGVIMNRKIILPQADYTEEFTDGTADLTWVENTAAANTGGLNLTVAADSAGLTNVGIWTDDANTGLIYADLGKKLLNYEVSADVYIVKEPSATEPLYKGIGIKMDPVEMAYYRLVYRNSSSSSNGAIKLQGFDGASWYISKQWDAGVDFDTLETGFHNFKAQVVDNKFWIYVDDELLPGCPYTHDGAPVVSAGYPGMYVYTGTVEFDNFKVNVLEYPKYAVTANVDMGVMVRRGEFDVASNNLDVMGSFDGWSTGVDMTDADGDTIWSAPIGEHEAGTTIYYKYRRNGAWDNTEEFPYGGPAREYVVLDQANQQMPAVLYGDITEVPDAVDGVPAEFALEQNYPNPFNPATTVKFQIPNSEMVNISIYDISGRKVAEVMNTQLEAGYYSVNFNASVLPSGVYLYRITAGTFNDVKKMTLLK
jgi:photosystem II stability/assembly factor-like uncharacterized protein